MSGDTPRPGKGLRPLHPLSPLLWVSSHRSGLKELCANFPGLTPALTLYGLGKPIRRRIGTILAIALELNSVRVGLSPLDSQHL
jgi:hypothetical protein